MSRSPRNSLIKRLQAEMPRAAPFGLAELKKLGIPAQQAAAYVRHGWLVRRGRGAYAFPGEETTPLGAAKFLQQRVSGLHVGGKSALALQGVRHNLVARDVLVLWGDARFVLPAWLAKGRDVRYISAKLFDWQDQDLSELTITTPPGLAEGLRVSTPERAALEMLYEVGRAQDLEEARNVFEGLRNLRVDVTGRLLSCCTSVKAVRLFLKWSREVALLDVELVLQKFHPRVGSDKRWMTRLNDGTLLTLKPHG